MIWRQMKAIPECDFTDESYDKNEFRNEQSH